jgi:hypothetical protein
LKKIVIEAGHLPELIIQPKPTYYNRIIDVLKKEKENGMTNHEICIRLNVKERRRVSEQIAAMKDQGKVIERRCRCGHAPIYYFYK